MIELDDFDSAGKRTVKCQCGLSIRTHYSVEYIHHNCSRPQLPGTHAEAIFRELGIRMEEEGGDCRCLERKNQMNAWGPEGCEQNRGVIVGWFREAADTRTLLERVAIRARLAFTDWFDSSRPYDSVLDEAIRRSKNNP